jgi:metal-responsive CopG/Arc/MetJ family transcriptional regulator
MPRRKDKEPSTMVSTGIRMPAQLLDNLNSTADTKGITRSALIVQILTKATKAKTTKSREDER